MADYTPLLTRAVAGQDEAARAAIYARARDALERQLRGYEPQLSEAHIAGELEGLNAAIATVEAQALAASPLAAEGPGIAEPAPVVPEPMPEPAPEAAPSTESLATPNEAEVLAASSTDEVSAPVLEPTLPANARPRMPLRHENTKSRKSLVMAAGAALIVILGMGGLAMTRRSTPDPLRNSQPGQTQEASADTAKTEGRLAGETPPARPATPAEPSTPASQPGAPKDSETAPLSTSTRAFMVLESPGNAPSQFEGRGLWSFEPDPASKGEKTLRTLIAFPGAELTIDLSLSRNKDAALPASHLIMTVFDPPKGVDPVREMSAIEWREREAQPGSAFQGSVVPVQDNVFMIALDKGAQAANLDLLRAQKWLVFEFRLANGRRGAVLVEKGAGGDKAVAEALTAWK